MNRRGSTDRDYQSRRSGVSGQQSRSYTPSNPSRLSRRSVHSSEHYRHSYHSSQPAARHRLEEWERDQSVFLPTENDDPRFLEDRPQSIYSATEFELSEFSEEDPEQARKEARKGKAVESRGTTRAPRDVDQADRSDPETEFSSGNEDEQAIVRRASNPSSSRSAASIGTSEWGEHHWMEEGYGGQATREEFDYQAPVEAQSAPEDWLVRSAPTDPFALMKISSPKYPAGRATGKSQARHSQKDGAASPVLSAIEEQTEASEGSAMYLDFIDSSHGPGGMKNDDTFFMKPARKPKSKPRTRKNPQLTINTDVQASAWARSPGGETPTPITAIWRPSEPSASVDSPRRSNRDRRLVSIVPSTPEDESFSPHSRGSSGSGRGSVLLSPTNMENFDYIISESPGHSRSRSGPPRASSSSPTLRRRTPHVELHAPSPPPGHTRELATPPAADVPVRPRTSPSGSSTPLRSSGTWEEHLGKDMI